MNDRKLIKLDFNERMTYGQYTQDQLISKIEELQSELIHLSTLYQKERDAHDEICPLKVKELMMAYKQSYEQEKSKLEEMGF